MGRWWCWIGPYLMPKSLFADFHKVSQQLFVSGQAHGFFNALYLPVQPLHRASL
jgi:hypothetical protein